MNKVVAILTAIILIGCGNDESQKIENPITERVDFTIDGIDRSFVNEYSWEALRPFTRSTYVAIGDNLSDDGIWFGTHLNSDYEQELSSLTSDEEKLNFIETTLTDLENSFVDINSVLSDDLECCFVCFGEFQSLGYSVNLFENISDCTVKEIWSSTYGVQTNAQLELKSVVNLVNPNPDQGQVKNLIMASFSFKCTTYNNIEEQRDISGEIMVPIHAY